MLGIKKTAVALLFGAAVSSSFAVTAKSDSEVIKEKLAALKISVDAINESPVKGLYEIQSQGAVYYMSSNGQFLIDGDMYDLNNGMQNLTKGKVEQLRRDKAAVHFEKMKSFEKDMIVYKAENEKYVVTVFTDTSCGYCQKLHAEIPDYNKLGITIRYLAYPRAGVNSNAYRVMESIWCAKDPKEAMDKAKSRRSIPTVTCDNNIKEQYQLGGLLGVRGTPALFLEDGTSMPGYLPADALLQRLQQTQKIATKK